MAYSRQSAAILAPGAHACSTNFSFRLMTRCSFQGTHSEDHCQRCTETFVSAMSWYCTPGPNHTSLTRTRCALARARQLPRGCQVVTMTGTCSAVAIGV